MKKSTIRKMVVLAIVAVGVAGVTVRKNLPFTQRTGARSFQPPPDKFHSCRQVRRCCTVR